MNYSNDEKFNTYLNKINTAFQFNPSESTLIIKKYIDYVSSNNFKMNKGITINLGNNVKYLFLVIINVMILSLGFFNISNIGLYVFGWIFFVAGMLIGMFVPGFGLIFFLSHGCTGLGLMLNSLDIGVIYNNIIIAPDNVKIILIGCLLLLAVLTLVFVIMCNFPKNRENKYFLSYPFICVFLGLLLINLSPYIIKFLS